MREIECQRTNVTPRAFYNYALKRAGKKELSEYLPESFDEWTNPSYPERFHINEHKDWDKPQCEALKLLPYEYQIFLQDSYNAILEFDFYDDKTGNGYCYIQDCDMENV